MKDEIAGELTQLGLTPTEAQIYLALIQNGPMGASAIAAATSLARTAVYPALGSLVDKGLVDAGEGYGSRFSVVPAEQALPHLMESDKEALLQRERLTSQILERISSMEELVETPPGELIQVLRSPRAVSERFERLQLEAERQIEVFSKAPYFNRDGNEAEQKVLRRGVRARAIYEKAGVEDPAIKPYFHKWIAAGEEARIYDGELPHKMVIFDSHVVLMPLFMPGEQMRALLIRNAQLAQSLSLAFEFLWERSKPLATALQEKMPTNSTRGPSKKTVKNSVPKTLRNDGHLSSRRRRKVNSNK